MINDLLILLKQLEDGTYKKDNITIIKKYKKKGYDAEILIGDILYTISDTYNNGYTINKKLDANSILYCSSDMVGKLPKYINTEIDNNNYNIYEYGISKNDEAFISLTANDDLVKRIDDNTVISINLSTNTEYVYYRKYNSLKASTDLENDYIKKKYDSYLAKDINTYNEKIKTAKDTLKFSLKLNSLRELVDTLDINKLNDNVCIELNRLQEIVEIYNMYRNKFEIMNEKEYEEIESFVEQLITEPNVCKINKISSLIDNINLNDTNSVVRLRDYLNDLIKLKQNTKKKIK